MALRDGLGAALARPSNTALEAAGKQAAAYGRYATGALAGVVPWVPTGTEEARLQGALLVGMVPGGNPALLAASWAQGLAAFWLLPPAIFGPGVATAFGGAPLVVGGLTPLFSNPLNPASISALTMASILDAATRTVIVTLPVVGPVPLV